MIDKITSETDREIFKVALKAIQTASKVVMEYWPSPMNRSFDPAQDLTLREKSEGTGNYATIADEKSEAVILKTIKSNETTRGHGILSEESAAELTGSRWLWVIDPIDGTPPFKNGLPDFGVSIGILKDMRPEIGLIAMPALGLILAAKRGSGWQLMTLAGKKVRIGVETSASELDKALIGYDLGYTDRAKQLNSAVTKIADRVGYPVSYGSSSTGNFRLALGSLGAYFCANPTKFDIGAASVIVPEVGGVVTDMDGKPIDWKKKSTTYLAGRTPELHAAVLKAMRS